VNGRVVGNFQFTDLLGEGGIGAVYAAVDRMLGRPVAIKCLRPELAHDTRFVDRFRSEAASLARLNHPNITTLYSLHSEGQELLMIIELVEGRTLEDVLRASGKLTADECLALASQATEGFAYAHRMGVVHRDIKPANLMVTGDGSLKIMDFGIARIRGSQRMTRTGHIIGTLAYMAPEQIQGHEGDERSDIYSLGIVFYELLAGDPPFIADSEYQLIRAQVEEPPRALAERLPGIDPAINQAVMRALAKEPAERFATMQEFSRALGSTMGMSTAKETMVRRVGPLVSQLAATRQRPMLTDPGVAPPPSPSRAPASQASIVPPSPSQWSTPQPEPAAAPDRKRRISAPVLLLGGVVAAFVVGIGYILMDTFFAATTAEPPSSLPGDVVTPGPSQTQSPPPTTVTSTESPAEKPAPAPSPAVPTPTAPAVQHPSPPPLAPIAPKQAPAIGSIAPQQPVDEGPGEAAKPEEKPKKQAKPSQKRSQPADRSSGGSNSGRSKPSPPPAQSGSSGWAIQRN